MVHMCISEYLHDEFMRLPHSNILPFLSTKMDVICVFKLVYETVGIIGHVWRKV